jgi:FKBP-type peptidyl-prolyl cis-trans isomerase
VRFAIVPKDVMRKPVRTLFLSLMFVLAGTVAAANGAFQTTLRGARYQDLVPGAGPAAEPGDVATMHIVSWLGDHGKKGREFYNTRQEDGPVSFVIGTNWVMPGWNEGVTGMRKGGRRLLLLPPALGFGPRGVDDIIPPNAALILQIELVDLEKPPAQ